MNTPATERRPLLSICIPTYNRIGYLKQVLEVLIPQLTDEVEINVSDNNSPDETWEYLGSLGNKVNRVRPPVGTKSNFNILSCVTLGKGVYTWIHCDDDIARLNAVENILRAIKEYDYPPALTFEWDSYDVNMSGFTNSPVTAKWKRCDRDEFLRKISYKFTFGSAIVVKKECVDVEYVKTHAPTDLIPGNIMLSTVGKYNDVVVSEVPLLAARANPGVYDALTIFSKQVFQLFQMNKGLGYDQAAFRQMYSDSLKTVLVHGSINFPIFLKGLWNVSFYSCGYKNFYVYVVPTLVRRYVKRGRGILRRFRKKVLYRLKLRAAT
jgi:glycosyltransferase involved in cell wall biosynthesis